MNEQDQIPQMRELGDQIATRQTIIIPEEIAVNLGDKDSVSHTDLKNALIIYNIKEFGSPLD